MEERYASNSIPKVIDSATAHVHTHPYVDRCEYTTSDLSITVGRATRETCLLGSARMVAVVGTLTNIGVRGSSIIDKAEA